MKRKNGGLDASKLVDLPMLLQPIWKYLIEKRKFVNVISTDLIGFNFFSHTSITQQAKM